jgi:hypothetical protein
MPRSSGELAYACTLQNDCTHSFEVDSQVLSFSHARTLEERGEVFDLFVNRTRQRIPYESLGSGLVN